MAKKKTFVLTHFDEKKGVDIVDKTFQAKTFKQAFNYVLENIYKVKLHIMTDVTQGNEANETSN